MTALVVGDVLLDVDVDGRAERLCPDEPVPVLDVTGKRARPGGAGLAAALLAADGADVTLVAAFDPDPAGARLRSVLDGVRLVEGPGRGGTAVRTTLRAAGRTLLRADSGDGRPGRAFGAVLARRMDAALVGADAVLVADHGRGVVAEPAVRAALARAAQRRIPLVWCPHPGGPVPVPGTSVATADARTAALAARHARPADHPAAVAVARALLRRWECRAVAVTLGERGAVLVRRDGSHRCFDPPSSTGRVAVEVAARLAAGLAAGTSLEDVLERP